MTVVGPTTDIPQVHGEKVLVINRHPILKSKVVTLCKDKEYLYTKAQKEELPDLTQQVSNKCPSQDESSNSHRDCYGKKIRPSLNKPRNTNLHVEILDSDDSSSRTPTNIKEVMT